MCVYRPLCLVLASLFPGHTSTSRYIGRYVVGAIFVFLCVCARTFVKLSLRGTVHKGRPIIDL